MIVLLVSAVDRDEIFLSVRNGIENKLSVNNFKTGNSVKCLVVVVSCNNRRGLSIFANSNNVEYVSACGKEAKKILSDIKAPAS